MNDEDDLNVDLTPLIDVIFMLVIFFIMTMSFSLPVVEFALPQAATAQLEDKSTSLRLYIKKDGSMLYNEMVLSFEEIRNLVQEKSQENKDLSLEVVIDKDAASQHLIAMADLARLYTQGRLLVVAEIKKD